MISILSILEGFFVNFLEVSASVAPVAGRLEFMSNTHDLLRDGGQRHFFAVVADLFIAHDLHRDGWVEVVCQFFAFGDAHQAVVKWWTTLVDLFPDFHGYLTFAEYLQDGNYLFGSDLEELP